MVAAGELKHPATHAATITGVLVSGDLQVARICVRSVEGNESQEARRELLRGFSSAEGFVRRALASRLSLRRVPSLRFEWDDSVDHGRRIEELLAEIHSEPKE